MFGSSLPFENTPKNVLIMKIPAPYGFDERQTVVCLALIFKNPIKGAHSCRGRGEGGDHLAVSPNPIQKQTKTKPSHDRRLNFRPVISSVSVRCVLGKHDNQRHNKPAQWGPAKCNELEAVAGSSVANFAWMGSGFAWRHSLLLYTYICIEEANKPKGRKGLEQDDNKGGKKVGVKRRQEVVK